MQQFELAGGFDITHSVQQPGGHGGNSGGQRGSLRRFLARAAAIRGLIRLLHWDSPRTSQLTKRNLVIQLHRMGDFSACSKRHGLWKNTRIFKLNSYAFFCFSHILISSNWICLRWILFWSKLPIGRAVLEQVEPKPIKSKRFWTGGSGGNPAILCKTELAQEAWSESGILTNWPMRITLRSSSLPQFDG